MLLLAGSCSAAIPADKLYELLAKQVVLVETFDDFQQPRMQGSAVVLGKSLCTNFIVAMDQQYQNADKEGLDFLSNYHVIAFASKITIQSKTGEKCLAAVVFADADRDLAIIRSVKRLALDPVSILTTSRVGQKVFALGAPKGLGWSLSDGIISGFRERNSNHLIQTTAPISPGSSGGGLFDEDGHLLGITTSQVENGQNLNFARAFEANESIQLSVLRRGNSVRPSRITDDEWAVGYIRRPAKDDSDWRKTNPRWLLWNEFNYVLSVPPGGLKLEFDLRKYMEAQRVSRNFYLAHRAKRFSWDVEGQLASVEIEDNPAKKRKALESLQATYPDNTRVLAARIEYAAVIEGSESAYRVLSECVNRVPTKSENDASESAIRLGVFAKMLRNQIDLLEHIDPRASMLLEKLKGKGW